MALRLRKPIRGARVEGQTDCVHSSMTTLSQRHPSSVSCPLPMHVVTATLNTQCANASLTFPFNRRKGIGDTIQHAMCQCGVPLPLDGREVPTHNVPENSNAVARRNMFVTFVALAKVPQQSIWTHVFHRLGVCDKDGWLPSLQKDGYNGDIAILLK